MHVRDGCLRIFTSHADRETLDRRSSELRVFLGELIVEVFHENLAAFVV